MKRVITFCVLILYLELAASYPFPEELLGAQQPPRTVQYNFAQPQPQNFNQGPFENVASYQRQLNPAYPRGTTGDTQYPNNGYQQNTQRLDFVNRKSTPQQRNNFENYFRDDTAMSQTSKKQMIEQIQKQIREQPVQNEHLTNQLKSQNIPQNQNLLKRYAITSQAPSQDQIQEQSQGQINENQEPKSYEEHLANQRRVQNAPQIQNLQWNDSTMHQKPLQNQKQIYEQQIQKALNERLSNQMRAQNVPKMENLRLSNPSKAQDASQIEEQIQKQQLQRVFNENMANEIKFQNVPQVQNFRWFDHLPSSTSQDQILEQQLLNENLGNQIRAQNIPEIQNFRQFDPLSLQTPSPDQIQEQIEEQILQHELFKENLVNQIRKNVAPQILNRYSSIEPDNTPLVPINTVNESYLNTIPSSFLRNNFENNRPVPPKKQYFPVEQQLPLIGPPQNQWKDNDAENNFGPIEIQEPYQVPQTQPTKSDYFENLLARLKNQEENTADEKQTYNEMFWNNPRIKNVLATTKPEKRYLVVHPDGTVVQVDELASIADKYPNYLLVNAETIGQEEPKTLAEASAEIALLSTLAAPQIQIRPVHSPVTPVAPSVYTPSAEATNPFNPVSFIKANPVVISIPSVPGSPAVPAIPTSITATETSDTNTSATPIFTSVVEATKALNNVAADAIKSLKNLSSKALNASFGALRTPTVPTIYPAQPAPATLPSHPLPTTIPATAVEVTSGTIIRPTPSTQAPSTIPVNPTASTTPTTTEPASSELNSSTATSAQSTQNVSSSTTENVSSYISNSSSELKTLNVLENSIDENFSSSTEIDLSKVNTVGQPVVWFKTSDFDLWKKLVGEDMYSVLYFFQVPSPTIVEKDTKTTVLANGTIIEEVTELVRDPSQDEPVINHTIKITGADGQIINQK